MSILYQALKRREQLNNKLESGPRFTAGLSLPRQASTTASATVSVLRFLIVLLLLIAAGVTGYRYYFTELPATEPAPVITAAAPPSTPAVASVAVTETDTDAVTIDNMLPEDLRNIAAVAAMLPDSAQAPLPLPQSLAAGQAAPITVDAEQSGIALTRQAQTLQRQGANLDALTLYNSALNSGDADFSTQVNKWGLVASTAPAEALPHLRQLVQQRPRDAAARAQLGLALLQSGQATMARTELERAAALAPDSTPESAQVWYNLAVLYDQNQERAAAIIAYEKALRSAMIHNQQAMLDIAAMQRRLNFLRTTPAVDITAQELPQELQETTHVP